VWTGPPPGVCTLPGTWAVPAFRCVCVCVCMCMCVVTKKTYCYLEQDPLDIGVFGLSGILAMPVLGCEGGGQQ
jgi:hypothetical protein